MQHLLEDCQILDKPVAFSKTYYDALPKEAKNKNKIKFDDKNEPNKFFVDLMGKNDKGKVTCMAKVRLQVDVLPMRLAEKNKVGKARDSPNHSPFLPQPQGRLEFSMNPLKMINQLVGPALKRKIYCMLCCVLCLIVTVPALPSVAGMAFMKAIGLG